MARFELNIYGADDEIVKTYRTDRIRYGVFVEAMKLDSESNKMSNAEEITAANALIKAIFVGLTDDELIKAEMTDVFNVYRQIVATAAGIHTGSNSKN